MNYAMFIPLTKVDAVQRLVYGSFDETPDRAGEICDYATAKPAFQAWSDSMSKASEGKNLGNIRGQHDLKKAAGKLVEITFNDEAKRVEFCAKIVDDAEWTKVEERVYTGFSPGGKYAKRWPDGSHHRYTPIVGELSIVDCPCNPSATFTMVKADGTEEETEFVLGKAYEPGNEATKARAEEMAKAADGTTYKDHVVQARADLIAENASQALAKMADAEDIAEPGVAHDPAGDVTSEPDHASKLDAALAKADAALAGDEAPVSASAAYAGALSGQLRKSLIDLPVAPPSPEAVALIGGDLVKSFAAVDAIRAAAEPVLAKGLYQLTDAVASLRSFSWLAQEVTWEANAEGDGSKLPQMAVDLVNGLKAFLIALVEEEVCEMLSTLSSQAESVDLVIEADDDVMELANQIIDLVKADTARMEKAGARNSAMDATRIQTIHDKACELGAGCSDSDAVQKAANLAAENDRLAKSVERAIPAIETLSEQVETLRTEREADRETMTKMAEQIETLGGQPAPTKIQLAISKEEDNGGLEKVDEDATGEMTLAKAQSLAGPERTRALELIAHQERMKQIPTPGR